MNDQLAIKTTTLPREPWEVCFGCKDAATWMCPWYASCEQRQHPNDLLAERVGIKLEEG